MDDKSNPELDVSTPGTTEAYSLALDAWGQTMDSGGRQVRGDPALNVILEREIARRFGLAEDMATQISERARGDISASRRLRTEKEE